MYVTYGCPTVSHFLDNSLQKYISEVKKKSHVSENLKIIHIIYIYIYVCVCVYIYIYIYTHIYIYMFEFG